MRFSYIRLAPLARSLRKAATVLVLGVLLPLLSVSQAAATATNGFLTTSFVTDGLCLAGPYKNSETADLSITYGADTANDLERVSLTVWNEFGGGNGSIGGVYPPPGSTAATETVQRSFTTNHIVGTTVYLYLYQAFLDAGDGRAYNTSPSDPPDVTPGFEGYYHQTAIDMALDPDCIPRPDVQLEYNGAVSSGPATALNGRDFGDVWAHDGPVNRTFTLRSIGISSVDVSQIRTTGSAAFSVSPTSPGPISATAPFTLTFTPLASGSVAAQLEIVSDAVSGTISVPLAGNVLVDSTSPSAPAILTPTDGSVVLDNTPAIEGTAEALSAVTIMIDGGVVGVTPALADGTWSYTSALLANGLHRVSATATDAASNISASSPETMFTIGPVFPTVTIAASAPVSAFGAPVTFTATVTGHSPTGSVQFFDGGTSLGSVPLSGNVAELTIATLGAGPHNVTAHYSGDSNNIPVPSVPVLHVVGYAVTTVNLAASSATSAPGQEVTFTATVSPATASGTVTFLIDSVPQTPVALSGGGVATFRTSLLTDGSHTVVARYDGDTNHIGSVTSLTHTVLAQGSVIIRQETQGGDAVFGFSSPTPELNLSIPTSGGRGESPAVSLAAGTYTITADDMSGAGFGLTALVCSDNDSVIDTANRSASLVLDAGEALICTFTSVQSRDRTVELIEDFLTTRASLILSNQPDIQRRIDRLNGVASSGGNPVSSLLGYLPGVVSGSPLAVSTSLGAIDRLAGNEATSTFDIWLEGTFAVFDTGGPDGNFSAASFGADYLVTPDLLIGGFVQVDHLAQGVAGVPAISGTGWLAGPYVTALLHDNLYLDLVAAAGGSQNRVSPLGTYEDGFDATRWLVSASLQGQWQWDDWTFSPRARLSYFEETTQAYIDSLGVGIPSITAGLGQIAVGPAISYRFTTEGDVVIDTGLRLEGVAEMVRTTTGFGFDNLHGRIEGTIDLSLPGGARFGLSTAVDGIGGDTGNATSAKLRVSLPID